MTPASSIAGAAAAAHLRRLAVPVRGGAALRVWQLGLASLVALGGLGGCVTPTPPLAGAYYSGRLAVRSEALDDQPARSTSGAFELSGGPQRGQLRLNSPLGTAVAQARWQLADGGRPDARDLIELDTGGATRRYASLDAMMLDALGDSLPLAAMFDWLRGRPWPQAPAETTADGGSFTQLGWVVDRSRLASEQRLEARRALPPPALQVRVRLDAAPTPEH